MFNEETTNRDRVLFWILIVAVFGGLGVIRFYAGSKRDTATAEPQAAVLPTEPARTTSVPAEMLSIPEREAAIARVYECELNGQLVLSDQRCGDDAQVRVITEPNRMKAQDTRRLYERQPASPAAQSRSSRPAMTDRGLAARCAWIEDQIDRINARMRQGYKNGEAERTSLRRLSAERWDIECRFLKTPASQR